MMIPKGSTLNSEGTKFEQHKYPTFKDKKNCIKLKRNLYGTKQASKNCYNYLTEGLEKENFQPSSVDPCLWLRHDCMVCLYVDDCVIFADNQTTIDSFIKNMRARDYLLQDEGDIENFLGVNINKTDDDRLEMLQTGLIDDIIKDLGLDNPKCKHEKYTIPAREVFYDDLHLPEFKENWKYRSLIGKLNFLALNSIPDIAFFVH